MSWVQNEDEVKRKVFLKSLSRQHLSFKRYKPPKCRKMHSNGLSPQSFLPEYFSTCRSKAFLHVTRASPGLTNLHVLLKIQFFKKVLSTVKVLRAFLSCMIRYLDINIYLKCLKFSDFCIFTCTVHARAARLLNEFVLCI